MARRLVTRSLVFSRRAFETRFDVLGLGRPFFESLVFTFRIIILQSRSPDIVGHPALAADRKTRRIGRDTAVNRDRSPTGALRQLTVMAGAGHTLL